MRALGVILSIVAVIVVLWTVVIVIKLSATRSKSREARRLNEERRNAPWQHFSRPGHFIGGKPRKWVVGVERVLPDGSTFDPEEDWQGNLTESQDRIQAEGEAIAKAVQYNDLKVGMQ